MNWKSFTASLEKQLKCSSSKKRQVCADVFAGLNMHPVIASVLKLFLSVQRIILVGKDLYFSPVPHSVQGQLDEVGCKALVSTRVLISATCGPVLSLCHQTLGLVWLSCKAHLLEQEQPRIWGWKSGWK